MARGGVSRSNMLLLLRGSTKRGESCGSIKNAKRSTTSSGGKGDGRGVRVNSSSSSYSCCWVPHPRTGIYFPVGHEWVMEDVPDGAATFPETCCFRN